MGKFGLVKSLIALYQLWGPSSLVFLGQIIDESGYKQIAMMGHGTNWL